jgi:hypothetical protein
VDGDSHHSERYGKDDHAGRFDISMGRTDSEYGWTRRTAYTGRHECVAKLVDPIRGRVLARERFVVHVGKPLPRYQRKLGRRRR